MDRDTRYKKLTKAELIMKLIMASHDISVLRNRSIEQRVEIEELERDKNFYYKVIQKILE
jgi:hypothetical protein